MVIYVNLWSLAWMARRASGLQKILHHLQDSSLYLVAMENAASHNNKVIGFHREPAAFRAGPGKPCVAFLGFWKNDSFLALWYLISKAFFSLLLTSQLQLRCRLLSRLNQSPGNTLKPVPGFTSEIQYTESDYQKVLLTSMHSNPISKPHRGLLLLLFVDSHNSSGNSKTLALRTQAGNCNRQS